MATAAATPKKPLNSREPAALLAEEAECAAEEEAAAEVDLAKVVDFAELLTAELSTAELSTAELLTAELLTAELLTAELSTAELLTAEPEERTIPEAAAKLASAVGTAVHAALEVALDFAVAAVHTLLNAELALEATPSGQAVLKHAWRASASELQTQVTSFNWLQVGDDLTTEAAQARRQADGVAAEGATKEATRTAREM